MPSAMGVKGWVVIRGGFSSEPTMESGDITTDIPNLFRTVLECLCSLFVLMSPQVITENGLFFLDCAA